MTKKVHLKMSPGDKVIGANGQVVVDGDMMRLDLKQMCGTYELDSWIARLYEVCVEPGH